MSRVVPLLQMLRSAFGTGQKTSAVQRFRQQSGGTADTPAWDEECHRSLRIA